MNGIIGSILLALALVASVVSYVNGTLALLVPFPGIVTIVVAVAAAVAMVTRAARASAAALKIQEMTMHLETANIKLTQLDKLKSEFLSFASHQIKSPMTVVKGYATLIVDGSYGPISDGVRDVAEKIRASADRMIGLVNTFLDLRKLDEGKMTFTFEDIEIGPLVASAVDELQQLATAKGLILKLEPLPQQWRLHADPQHLRQVMQNLIDNAIKYTDHGSVTVSLSQGDGNTVRISVTDTGRGISKELVGRLFEQFTRDQSIAKEIAGTGLGLYIAKQMVLAHNGKVWASSPGPGKGSTFIVELPHL